MEEVSEVEVLLVRKRKRLMRVGDIVSARENVSADEAMSTRDVAEQREGETASGEDLVAPEEFRSG